MHSPHHPLTLHCLTIHGSSIPAEQLSGYSGHKSSQGKWAQLLERWSQDHKTPTQGRMKPSAFVFYWKHNLMFVKTCKTLSEVLKVKCMTNTQPKWRSCPVTKVTVIFSSAQLTWSLSFLNFNKEKETQRLFPMKIKFFKIWNWTSSDNFLHFQI